jgi:hypothetical protein
VAAVLRQAELLAVIGAEFDSHDGGGVGVWVWTRKSPCTGEGTWAFCDEGGGAPLGRLRDPRSRSVGGGIVGDSQVGGRLPSGCATKRLEQQFIRETSHRNPALPGLMVEDGDDKPGNHGRIVGGP